MAIVTLGEQKAHMRVEFSDDDIHIEALIEAAQSHLEQLLGYEIEEEFETLPSDIIEAVMQLAASWYENREATSAEALSEVPIGLWAIIRERRNYSF